MTLNCPYLDTYHQYDYDVFMFVRNKDMKDGWNFSVVFETRLVTVLILPGMFLPAASFSALKEAHFFSLSL